MDQERRDGWRAVLNGIGRRETPVLSVGLWRKRRQPSLAHLRFHRLQRLAAADAHLFLVRLEAADDASAARLHAWTKPLEIRLAIFHRRGLLGERGRRGGHESRERQRRGDCKMTNAHVSLPLPLNSGLKTAAK